MLGQNICQSQNQHLHVQTEFRLLNNASEPEIVYFGSLNGAPQPQSPLGKVGGGEASHLFQWVLR